MALKPSRRSQAIGPFIVMDVLRAANERAASGKDVLHLEVGQPGLGAPAPVIEAARAAMARDRLGYTEAFGVPALRGRIARHYRETYGVSVPVERIVVTTGSSGAFILGFLAAFDAGERVAMAAPGYPAYRNILTALGVEVVEIPTGASTRYQPTPALLSALDEPVSGLVVASPSNPSGTMLGEAELRSLCDYCRAHGIRLVSDEIYHGIVYGSRAHSSLEFDPETIVVNSFSKYFCMTGWRLGWLILPEDLVRPVERLSQNFFISPPTLSQHAAIAAFDCREELDGRVAAYARSRAMLMEELPKAGFGELAPIDGAFYVYADVGGLSNDAGRFCRELLADTGIAITPGMDFDPAGGNRHVRFSFAGDPDEVAEAARRLVMRRARR